MQFVTLHPQQINMKATRLHNLDYLRGLCALSIMAYHYAGFAYEVQFSPDDFMQKIGIYGVSIFYVLSGLTLFHVYCDYMKPDGREIADFFIKRGFRIMPLLWVVMLSNIFLWGWPGWRIFLLNVTGLFGIIAPTEYYGVGVWSIGNELVFYLFFPLFMFLFRRSPAGLVLVSLVLLAEYCYFAYHVFPGFGRLHAGAWTAYVNPLNQVLLFLSGFLSGVFLKSSRANNRAMLLVLLLSAAIFVFYPVEGADSLPLITGNIRMLYTLLSIFICLAAYKLTFQLPYLIDKPLRVLGEISYSLYLLHPIVWFTIGHLSDELYPIPVYVEVGISVVGTFAASYVSYKYFERYLIEAGRKISYWLAPKMKPEAAVVK